MYICICVCMQHSIWHINPFFSKILLIFREGKGGRKRGRETSMGCLLHIPTWGPGLQTQSCVLTGDLLVHRLALNPLSHTSQGNEFLINVFSLFLLCCGRTLFLSESFIFKVCFDTHSSSDIILILK